MGPVDVRWMTLFADVPARAVERELAFWSDVSASSPGPPEGDHGQYLPLEPRTGDSYLWLQRVDRDEGGWHLDLHVPDPEAATALAEELGAHRHDRRGPGLSVLTSPGGQPFCLVHEEQAERARPAAAAWPGGHASEVDQLCVDIPADRFDAEADFWSALTAWPRAHSDLDEFDNLRVADGLPLRVLLQRLGADDTQGIRAHADLSTDDRPAETTRHVDCGAAVQLEAEYWTTLRDPAGLVYCITDRRPH
jgi:hypothetical protein